MSFLPPIKTLRQEIQNAISDLKNSSAIPLSPEESRILKEIKKTGVYVIPNFYSGEECSQLISEIDSLMAKYSNQLFIDEFDVDHRIFGADRISTLIKKFFTNDFINRITASHQKSNNLVGVTMIGRLEYKTGKIKGSGEGWHRDWAVNRQFKSILYLTDVTVENGPFEYLEGSHKHLNIINDCVSEHFTFNQSRFTDEQIETLTKKKYGTRLKTFTAKAGTLILANTRGMHRGMPIQSGVRYSMTNYYWSDMKIPSHIEKLIVKEN